MSIQDAIAKAKDKATENGQVAPQEPSTTQPQNQVVHQQQSYAPASPVQALTVEDAVKTSMAVDLWLKVEKGVVTLDGNTYSSVPVIVIPADGAKGGSFTAFIGLNYGSSDDSKYSKSYNGQTVDDGENFGMSWAEHVAQVQSIYPSAKPFNGYQLLLEVAEDIKDISGNNPIAKGTILGYSTSRTSATEVSKYIRKLMGMGQFNQPEEKRLAKLGGKGKEAVIKGKKTNWAVITLEDAGEYVDADDID